jgi:hypothetical protein
MGSDGKSLDVEGTARKIAEAHGHLERRLGSGDAPPASVDGYKLNVPETLAGKVNTEDLAKAPDFIEFQKNMHGLGLSQKQLDGVTAVLLERGIKMREAMPILDAAEATSKLRGMDGWKSDEEYQRQVGRAYAAGKHYAGNDFDGVLKDYGNDPRIVAMLARVGAELGEDTQPSPEALQQVQQSLDQLMASPAYTNQHHAQHKAVFDQVTALQAKLAGTGEARANTTMSFKT